MNSISGVGLSYRSQHHKSLLSSSTQVKPNWLELLTDNYLGYGLPNQNLRELALYYPFVFHGVGLNVMGSDPFDKKYIKRLKELFSEFKPAWFSDHLCWTSIEGAQSHDLLPFPFQENFLEHAVQRIHKIQDLFQMPFIIENVSAYHEFPDSQMSEVQFLAELCKKTSCKLLLDVNNIFVNVSNQGYDLEQYFEYIDTDMVAQIHLGGHAKEGKILIDTHGSKVCDEVWEIFERFIKKVGPVPACIEWDNDIPDYDTLSGEMLIAASYYRGDK